MRRQRDEAFVLGTHQLGEADLIVTLLAARVGRVRGVARGARRSRKRFAGALEPLTRVHASWLEREGRELHRIEDLEPLQSYAAMQAEPACQAACAVICEIAIATAQEGQDESRVFRMLGAVLEAMREGIEACTAVRYAEYWSLRLHGVLPDLDHCHNCGSSMEARGPAWAVPGEGLSCRNCRSEQSEGARMLSVAERRVLRRLGAVPPGELQGRIPEMLPGGALEDVLRGSLQVFVERGLRSYRHLAACYAESAT